MGNAQSASKPAGNDGGASPRHNLPARHRAHRSQPSQHRPSRDSTFSTTVSSTSNTSTPPPTSPVYTPQSSTLSPQTSRSSHHYRTTSAESSPVQKGGEGRMGNSQSSDSAKDKEVRQRLRERTTQSDPVQVPAGRQQGRNRGPSTQFEPSGPPDSDSYAPKSNLNFPPRLPLPIQEEVYNPGSPIITPGDVSTALEDDELDGALPHRSSLLSHTTLDDEEEPGEYELEAAKGKTVPTVIEWKQPANQVYITGTFTGWSKKYRLHRDPKTHVLCARLELLPGTHHVKFIVDGQMTLSTDLPTAVDYTNILVNYIEVSADNIPDDVSKDKAPDGIHPPLKLPEVGVAETDFAPGADSKPSEAKPESKAAEESKPVMMPLRDVHYAQTVPTYLSDLDRVEESNRFRRGAQHIAEIPAPPSLPLFLGKSILNGTTPMKDDSSVLNMPNHTVLNHLATSSIKNEVLATSVTTRYKRKYVTTITYKPSNPHD